MNFTFFQSVQVQLTIYSLLIDDANFQDMSEYCHDYEESNIFQEYFQIVREELGLSYPTNWRAAIDMYNNLCEIAQSHDCCSCVPKG